MCNADAIVGTNDHHFRVLHLVTTEPETTSDYQNRDRKHKSRSKTIVEILDKIMSGAQPQSSYSIRL
jgi:hypothetical protein